MPAYLLAANDPGIRLDSSVYISSSVITVPVLTSFIYSYLYPMPHLLAANAAALVAELAQKDRGGNRGRRFRLLFLRRRQQHHSLKIKQF
jgi:hypothetical protein